MTCTAKATFLSFAKNASKFQRYFVCNDVKAMCMQQAAPDLAWQSLRQDQPCVVAFNQLFKGRQHCFARSVITTRVTYAGFKLPGLPLRMCVVPGTGKGLMHSSDCFTSAVKAQQMFTHIQAPSQLHRLIGLRQTALLAHLS